MKSWSCSNNYLTSGLAGSLIGLIWLGATVTHPIAAFAKPHASTPQLVAQQSDVLTRAEIYKLQNQVELLPFNQSPRSAKLSDVLAPQDAVRTAAASIAELLFNEGSIARVDASTVFRFREGLRRFQLPNRVGQRPMIPQPVAMGLKSIEPATFQAQATNQSGSGTLQKETIFVLESGTALLMSPPNSVGTAVETPESTVNIIAPKLAGATSNTTTTGTTASGLLLPPERSSAVMVVHDPQQNSTRVFALTDGDIQVADRSGNNSVALIGGQTIAVTNGKLGTIEEFDLENFYRTVPLAEGLGPGQEGFVSQQPNRVQITLNAVRIETLAALRRQARERSTFTGTFLRDALNGVDQPFNRGFDGQRGRETQLIIGGEEVDGTFRRLRPDNAGPNIFNGTFTPEGSETFDRIQVDLNRRTIRINGVSGRSSDAGLSGNNASGTIQLNNGRVIRLEVFDVDGEEPAPGEPYSGRRIRGGIQPDH